MIDRKKLLALRKREKEKRHAPKPAQKEFTSKKSLGKFFFYRDRDHPDRINIAVSGLATMQIALMPMEELLEQCEYMESATPIKLSKNEFAKLEKYLTPLPRNVTVWE